jgi:general secretion pathway protein G
MSAPDQPRISRRTTLLVRGVVACVVIVSAIGLFTAWFTGHYAEKFAAEKRAKAREDFALVLAALEEYRRANGDYPDSLGALWVPDSHGLTYLSPTSPPKDPWGHGYGYAKPAAGQPPRLWTYGRDKREGGDGESRDVKSWEEDR